MNHGTEFTVWAIVPDVDASLVCAKLNVECEINSGDFTYSHEGLVTVFTAPCSLDDSCCRIAKAFLNGFRSGLVSQLRTSQVA